MKTLALTGGGTGGHLVVARALKEAALKQGIRVLYIGSTQGQDQAWFAQDKEFEACYFLATRGVMNQNILGKLFSLFFIAKATWQARRLLARHRVDAVISVGGYSAAPAALATLFSTVRLFIHEQNATMGRLNRLLKPFARHVFSSYIPPWADYPVREAFFTTQRIRSSVKTIIFLGGSQGAQAINALALNLAPKLHQMGIHIIHQCGEKHLLAMQEAYSALGVPVELFSFSQEMPQLLARADFAISRAGASSVWELSANGLPALFIPYPYATDDHQTANALRHVQKKLAWMMPQNALDAAQLLEIIQTDLTPISHKLTALIAPHGADKILHEVVQNV